MLYSPMAKGEAREWWVTAQSRQHYTLALAGNPPATDADENILSHGLGARQSPAGNDVSGKGHYWDPLPSND
jgi:hypothetical protein